MSMNDYSIQKVAKIRYKRAYYHPILEADEEFRMDYEETTVYELTEEGITSYIQKKGTKKREEKVFTRVGSSEMRAFIDKLQDFSRRATEAFARIDDCSHEVQFIYPGDHKEVFRLDIGVSDEEESLISQITGFVHDHQQED